MAMTENNKKVGETSSGEVVNGFRSCRDLSDIVPLYSARGLYLKPVAKVNVSVNLPQLKTPGNAISTWEVMEKIRMLIRPDEFASLKVVKSTLEFIRLEGDLRDRCRLQRVLARLESQRLNLAGFSSILKVRAAEVKDDFPTRHSWDSYFRDAKHMNELKPGERPDTIHIQGLPVKWFSEDGNTPDEAMVAKIFKKWGVLRRIDVPAADPYRSKMRLGSNIQKFSFGDGIFFDAYIQYIEYMDFLKAMDALRGMKLMKKEGQNYLTAALKVDFDKTKHMSDGSVSQREFERKRLIAQDNLAAEKQRRKEEADEKKREEQKKKEEIESTEKELRRRKREDKRKRKALTVYRKQEEDKVSMKIAREERKLIKAQRQLESIRLFDELFDRIKTKIERKEIEIKPKDDSKAGDRDSDEKSGDSKKKDKKDKKVKKKKSKKKKKRKKKKGSGSSSDSDSETKKKKIKSVLTRNIPHDIPPGPPLDPAISYAPMYPRFPQPWYYDPALPMLYPPMGRGVRGGRFARNRGRGNSQRRPMNNRSLRGFNPHLYNEQYYKYFANLAGQDYHTFDSEYERSSRSRSCSRRRSISRSRSRSKSRSNRRRRRRSDSRSRSRTRSRSRSRSRSRRRNRTRSRSRSRTRSKSRSKSRFRAKSKSRSRTRSKSRSRARSRTKSKSRSRRSKHSRSHSRSRRSSRSKRKRRRSESQVKITRAKSRTTSTGRRSRSSTWSLPKSPRQRSCSWSKEADSAHAQSKQKEKSQKKGDGDKKTNKEGSNAENKESNNKKEGNREDRCQKDSKKEENKNETKKDDSKKESRSEGTAASSKGETRSEAPVS